MISQLIIDFELGACKQVKLVASLNQSRSLAFLPSCSKPFLSAIRIKMGLRFQVFSRPVIASNFGCMICIIKVQPWNNPVNCEVRMQRTNIEATLVQELVQVLRPVFADCSKISSTEHRGKKTSTWVIGRVHHRKRNLNELSLEISTTTQTSKKKWESSFLEAES